MNRFFLTIIGLLLFLFTGKAQDCTEFHQFQCTYADYTYFYSQQSKSMLMAHGETKELNIIVYAGEEYYVTVCAHEKLGRVNFRILEDNPSRTVIYDNSMDNFSPSIIFANERTRKLIIQVIVPPGKSNDKEKRCLGVLLEFKKTKK
jgi:hypothetical protein